MIPISCPCGKALKVKDELAGKKVRCPQCSAVIQVPADDAAADEWDQWDDFGDDASDMPPKKKLSKPAGKRSKKKSAGGVKWGMKAIFGLLAIVIGAAIGVFICYSVFTGQGNARMLRGLAMPVLFIGFGIAWIKGDSFGG